MKICQLCGKKRIKVIKRKKLRGKFNPTKKYFQEPNLQSLLWEGKKILVCKDCRRGILKGKLTV